MKARSIHLLLAIVMGMLIFAPLCWAKEKSYNYIVAYSLRDKVAYYTPIFTQKVEGVSYNKEEYVSDTETVIEMESAFQEHLEKKMKVRSRDLTVSARVAYKTDEIAKSKLEKEIGDFRFKGFEIKEINSFNF